MKSLNDLSFTRNIDCGKSKVSTLIKKRKKIESFVKAF
jgi:hypothetical protein